MVDEQGKIVVTLTPSESRRLIAKGVVRLAEVQRALQHGTIIVTLGTTNAYVAEEILHALPEPNIRIDKQRYAAGVITDRGLGVVPQEERVNELILKKGKISEERTGDVLQDLSADDVFIKGANALDATGTAGILMANPFGGTIGSALGTVMARGVQFIIPVGIEKTVPYSIADAAQRVGIGRCYKTLGWAVGLMPVHGTIITELEAFRLLGADDAFPLAAGGVDGGEGSVSICVEARVEKLGELMTLVTGIKGEPPVNVVNADCTA